MKRLLTAILLALLASLPVGAQAPSPLLDETFVEKAGIDAYEDAIRNGADVNGRGPDDRVPLHYAVRWGTTAQVAALLDAGADPNLANAHGNSPLHWAASRWGNADKVRLLLGAGANVNAAASDGAPPLAYAMNQPDVDVARQLVEAGADVTVVNPDNQSLAVLAEFHGHRDVIDFVASLAGVPVPAGAPSSNSLNPVDRQQVNDFAYYCASPGGIGTQFDCGCLTSVFEAERAKGPERTREQITDLVRRAPPVSCLKAADARESTFKSCIRQQKKRWENVEERCGCVADGYLATMQSRPSAIPAFQQTYLYDARLACAP